MFKLEDFRFSSSSIDDFFQKPKPTPKIASNRIRVANLTDLSGFQLIAEDTLIRTSKKDFWKLGKDDSGYFIEKLVDDDSGPIKE